MILWFAKYAAGVMGWGNNRMGETLLWIVRVSSIDQNESRQLMAMAEYSIAEGSAK
jgi:hypothetical protein